MRQKRIPVLQGTLDMLILKALGEDEFHGLAVVRRIEQISQDAFHVTPGSLFPALHRMEKAGWLSSQWGESANNRRAKYYRVTQSGKRQLNSETDQWKQTAHAIGYALRAI